jgi:geranylgeranyl pyrophosphate synthase
MSAKLVPDTAHFNNCPHACRIATYFFDKPGKRFRPAIVLLVAQVIIIPAKTPMRPV